MDVQVNGEIKNIIINGKIYPLKDCSNLNTCVFCNEFKECKKGKGTLLNDQEVTIYICDDCFKNELILDNK